MMRTHELLSASSALLGVLLSASGFAQEASPIGRIHVGDAQIAGALEVSGGEAVLHGGATITARDRTAELRLDRGGEVQVCSTSVLHLTLGPRPAGAPAPLLMGLDRGAMQVHTAVSTRDALITPDLRFAITRAGLLNLGVRVVPNGDTCVDNSGKGAPVLQVTEQIGGGTYEVLPGQHVLFERGSVREVVDQESSSCGCPPATPPALIAGSGGGGATLGGSTPQIAATQHPFPAAESVGLAPGGPPAVPQAPAGEVHAQVGATLAYGEAGTDDGNGMTAAAPATGATPARPVTTAAPPAEARPATPAAPTSPSPERRPNPTPAPPAPNSAQPARRDGVFGSLGHFFRRLFGR